MKLTYLRMMKGTLLFIFSLVTINLTAQNSFGFKYFGLSIHPKGEKENSFLMPNKLDKNGYMVLNIGGVVSYEHFIYKDLFSVKAAQALYADCAARRGGFSHLGIRARMLKKGRHILSGGIGPTIVYRRNWLELDGYQNQNRFKGGENNRWQYLFLWYGGEFEYKYSLSDQYQFAASFIPGYPDLMSLSIGMNFIL